jgi:hypothetical protein
LDDEELFPAIKQERETDDDEVDYLNYPPKKRARFSDGNMDAYDPCKILGFADVYNR